MMHRPREVRCPGAGSSLAQVSGLPLRREAGLASVLGTPASPAVHPMGPSPQEQDPF